MSINHVALSGNLTAFPEVRRTAGGSVVMNFSVAVNERVKDKDGEWVDRPNFIPCAMFGVRADALSKILEKGMKVAIDGKLRWSSWEDKGEKRSKVEVIVESIDLMTRRKEEQPAQDTGYEPSIHDGAY